MEKASIVACSVLCDTPNYCSGYLFWSKKIIQRWNSPIGGYVFEEIKFEKIRILFFTAAIFACSAEGTFIIKIMPLMQI